MQWSVDTDHGSRLLMNYIQLIFCLSLAFVFKEDKGTYFESLQATKKAADINIFRDFMYGQYQKYLKAEIYKFKNGSMGGKNGGYGFLI